MFVLQFLQTNSIDLGIIEFVLSLFVFELSQDLVVFRRLFLDGILSESFGSWIGDFVGDFLESTGRDSTLMTVKNLLIFGVEWFVGYIVDAMG